MIGSQTVTLDETVSSRTVSIALREDQLYEGPEGFIVQLQTDDLRVVLSPQEVEVIIMDNEGMCSG